MSLLIFTLFLTGCFSSGGEESAGGGLFVDHQEVDNAFSLSAPANGVYAVGDNLDFVATHPSAVTVTGGTPRLAIDIGGSPVFATYLTGTGTANLTFRYTVQSGDNDSDGIGLPATVDFNGATLTFSSNGASVAANSEIVSAADASSVLVDTQSPTLTAVTPPSADTYYLGETLQFIAIFDDVVNVSGTPQLTLNLNSGDVQANYLSGSGSSTLIFRYTVTATDIDLDGTAYASPLNLNSGSINDINGNAASLTFTPLPMTTTFVDGDSPKVQAYTSPTDNTYGLGDAITFSLQFSEAVDVAGGTPSVDLDVGGTTVQASYLSGTGTDTLTFQYIVGQGLEDTNGIEIQNSISLNGATIRDAGSTDAVLDIAPPLTPAVLVDSNIPNIVSITPPSDDDYSTGETIDFIFEFDEIVTIANTPRVEIQLATGNIFAEYFSGSNSNLITFRYTVQAADSDLDGIAFAGTSLDLNTTGSITSSNTGYSANLNFSGLEPALTGVLVNSVTPTQLVITQQPSNTVVDGNISPAITVEIRDASNNLVTASTDTVTVAFGTDPSAGAATLGGTVSVAAVGGIATFSDLNIDTVNTGYTLTFSSGALTAATSSSFDITPIVATQLVFTQDPTDAVAGVSISPDITVEFRDASNNLVTSETSTVTLAIGTDPSSGAATLGGTLSVAAVGGIATFNDINIDIANTGYNLSASSGALTPGASSAFNITPAAASQLAYTVQPSNADVGVAISPSIEVQIQDAFGNVVNSTDNVTLSINNNAGPGGTLSGTLTQAAVAGTATFNDINIDTAGVGYTLDSSSGVLTTATSDPFDITAVPTQLVITQEPTNTEYSQNITPAITVEIRDASNNLVTSATDTVTVAFGTDPSAGAATLGGTASVAAVGGIATFSDLNIDTVNTGYTFSFTSGALTAATSTTFDILPGTATQLAFTLDPTDAVAGVTIAPDITVEFRDASNNLVSTETSNVTLSFGTDPSSGSATLGGTVTVAAVGGVATFNDINVDLANTGYTLTAASGALTPATSSAFNISPTAASQLAFSVEPTDAEIGNNIAPSIEVEIQDAFGNLVNSTDSVTLSINNNAGPGGTLSGTLTQAAVAGTATFNDINIDIAGTGYTLDANSGVLTTATSAAFNITQVPTQLIITQQPTDAANGSIIAPAITVEIRDASNNLVSSATDTVTVAFGTDPSTGAATLGGTLSVAAVSGVATFSDLTVDTVNSGYTLSFSSGSLTGATSTSFDILSPVALDFQDDTSHDFGEKAQGSSTDLSVIIEHSGSGTATITSSANPSADFTYKGGSFPGTGGTCTTSISANCLVVISYAPTSAGVHNATLSISYDNGASTDTITKPLTGEGTSDPPTKLSVTGSSGIITNDCIPFTINAVDDTDSSANVTSNETITLVVNNGTGSFYSDASCTSTTTSTTITSGTSSQIIYFETTTSGQSLTLIFNGSSLTNTSKIVTSASAPTSIYASASTEVETDSCSIVEVSLVDPSGVKTGASSAQTINLSYAGDTVFYNDSFCTGSLSSISFAAYEETKYVYIKNATIESDTFNLTDNAAVLTSTSFDVDFVSTLTWWDTDWMKRKKITVSNLDQATTFSNTPVLVKLNSSRINYDDFLGDGSDIRFTLDDHSTVLSHNIESWNTSGDSFVWIKLPTITASSEINIYMYYDNTAASDSDDAAGVFSAFEGAWNMDLSGSDYIDSTGSGKDGSEVGTLITTTGPTGNAVSFDGASKLDTGFALETIIGRTSTLSLWVKTTQVGNNTNWQAPGITGVEEAGGGNDIFFGFIRGDGSIAVNSGNSGVAASNFVVNDNTWRYVTIQRDETTGQVRFYINGVLNGTGTSETGYKSNAFSSFGVIEDTGGSPNYFVGEMDNIRLSNTYLDPEIVKAQFKFQADTHVSFGTLEEL